MNTALVRREALLGKRRGIADAQRSGALASADLAPQLHDFAGVRTRRGEKSADARHPG